MKKTLKRVILGLGITFMLFGCGVVKRQQEKNDYPLGTSMMVSCNITNGKEYQIDSIITADTLPQINKWLRSVYLDYETGKRYTKRMCIKTYPDGTETVYLILGSEEPYNISKRITQN